MTPKLTVRTRSCSSLLYSKMRSFIPTDVECIPHTAYDDWQGAARFLHDAIEMTTGYLLILDEDCFVVDFTGIENIILAMQLGNNLFAGVPDGGIIPHRCWSSIAVNPSFVIFDCDSINEMKKEVSREEIDATNYDPLMEHFKPYFAIGSSNEGHGEPFNGLFYWLVGWGYPLYLQGETLADGLTTAIKGLSDTTIAVHSWLSRDKDPQNQARIQKIYELALKLKK